MYADAALRVGLGPTANNYFIESDLTNVHSVEFNLSDGTPGKIVFDLVDIYIDNNGARGLSPLGSTPYSPQGLIELLTQDLPYQPTAEMQTILVEFRFNEQVDLASPLIGGIRLRVESENTASVDNSGITVQAAAVNVVSYLPTGYSVSDLMKNESNLEILNLDLFISKQESMIFRLLPNFSFLLNSKNLGVNFRFINSGEFFLSTNNEITLKRIQLLRPDQAEVIFTNITNTNLLMPGEVVDKNVPFEIESAAQQRKFNAIEQYGFYRLEMSTTGSLVGTEVIEKFTTKHFLVFPWKIIFITLFLLGIFYLLNQFRGRKQSKADMIEIAPESHSPVVPKVTKKPKKASKTVAIKKVVNVKKKPAAKNAAKQPVKKVAKKPVKKVAKKAVKKRVKAKS